MQKNKENFVFTLISRKFTPEMPDATVLSKHNSTHKAWFDRLYDDLFRIWEYARQRAKCFNVLFMHKGKYKFPRFGRTAYSRLERHWKRLVSEFRRSKKTFEKSK